MAMEMVGRQDQSGAMKKLIELFLVVSLVACGGEIDARSRLDGGSAELHDGAAISDAAVVHSDPFITGSVAGVTPSLASMASYVLSNSSYNQQVVHVRVSNRDGACPAITDYLPLQNEAHLDILLSQNTQYPIALGDHPISSEAKAAFVAADKDCSSLASEDAESGIVTLTTIDVGRVGGTFDLHFASGDLRGAFDAPACSSERPAAADCPNLAPCH